MTDLEIFEGIARKDNPPCLDLYETYQDSILRRVHNNNGTADEARDVFQEGVVGLWTNIAKGTFQLKDSARISTYLYALCRNIWISRLRKKQSIFSIDDNPQLQIADEVDQMEEQYDQLKMLEEQFKKLGEACQKLLKLFYYKKAKLKEIAIALDITEKTAKNNKYRCMQNLRSFYNQ